MKTTLLILCLAFAGCGPTEYQPIPISVEMLRKEAVDSKMRSLKDSAFLGTVDLGIRGGVEILQELSTQAEQTFPDGEYVFLTTYPDIPTLDGYTHHGVTGLHGFLRPIYRRDKLMNKQ